MILGNYAAQNRNCVRDWGVAFSNPFAQFKPPHFESWSVPDDANLTSLKYSGFPHGYNTSFSWNLPLNDGGLASTNNLNGSGGVSSATLWAVKLAVAALTGSGSLSATGSLIVQLVAALTGSGTVSAANLKAFLQAVAALTGSGTVSAGNLKGLAALLAALTASGTAGGSTLTGVGELDADLTVTGTGLTTANVGEAVWSALAASNNDAGTMGEKLNDAGSASNPWTEVIESGYTAAQILKLLAAVAQGDATGLDGSTVVFKSLDGNTDRITATQDGTDRTITNRDVT